MTTTRDIVTDQRDQFAFHDDIVYLRETKRGLTRETVEEISRFKDEPEWMLQFRLRAYDHFVQRSMPAWAEGLDRIFKEAGFQWREPGCSMCLGMNPDQLKPRQRCASTSNRNFEGRQGRGGRTHLVSPEMAAAAAIAGHFVDVRELDREAVVA